MAKQSQPVTPMCIGGDIIYGTPLHRVNEIVQDNPVDQESAEFFAGDIRDVCGICDGPKSLKDAVKGKPVGELVNLKLAEVRQLIQAARRSKPEHPAV